MKSTVQKRNNQIRLTLIELLIIVGIIAVIVGIVLVAVNPSRQVIPDYKAMSVTQ
jgi:Tfp pilus assembly protein FimT